jgi:branched-chain amino acid transport system ATP-binding protein
VTGTAGPLLRAKGLAKAFGGVFAVRDVSLDLEPGEIHALIGPNGAGKSTAIGLLHGTIRADAGSVTFLGRRLDGQGPAARARAGLARSYQRTAVFAELTVAEHVGLAVRAAGHRSFGFWRPAAPEAMAVLDRFGLGALAGRPAGTLAHGQQRLVELAMVVAAEPRAILMDEPFAGLAPDDRPALADLLAGLKDRHALLLVEHDMDVVFRIADRISVLVAGTVIASGPPDAVRADPEVQRAYLRDDG